ncbi:MFS transporter [Streptomyces sp. NPDC056049]|uniref:MFS transporter n=1 Tax=Streptomyces sp. NPDC056049 TaxID=3345693 RepID=UPI0035D8119C
MRTRPRTARRPSVAAHLTAALAARTGDEMSGPALALTGFAAAGSTSRAGALLACVTVSAALGGPLLGALLDKARRPGRLLAGALVLYAAGLGAVLFGLGRLPFAVTALLAVVTGLVGPVLSGGWTAQLPRIAPADRMPRLHGLDALTFSLAALAGPALAGGAALLPDAPTAVVLAAALVATAAPVAWSLPVAGPETRAADTGPGAREADTGPETRQADPVPEAREADAARRAAGRGPGGAGPGTPGQRSRGGVVAVFRRGRLLRATVSSVGCATATGVVAACLPALGARALGGSGRGALLLSVAAATALATTALHARLPRAVPPGRVLWGAAVVQAGAWAVAAAGGPVALVVAFAVAGAAEGPQLTALFTVRHEETPGPLRGRVFTTGAGLKITGFAVGAAVAGPVATRSVPAALLLAAAVCAVSALPYTRSRDAVRAAPGAPGRPAGRRTVRRREGLPGSSGRP